jgi:hypothetical protein
LLRSIIQRISPCPRLLLNFRNKIIFYGEELLAPRPTPKLKDHPLSAVRECLFNIFAATLHIWRPFPPSATWVISMPWWQGIHLTWTWWSTVVNFFYLVRKFLLSLRCFLFLTNRVESMGELYYSWTQVTFILRYHARVVKLFCGQNDNTFIYTFSVIIPHAWFPNSRLSIESSYLVFQLGVEAWSFEVFKNLHQRVLVAKMKSRDDVTFFLSLHCVEIDAELLRTKTCWP